MIPDELAKLLSELRASVSNIASPVYFVVPGQRIGEYLDRIAKGEQLFHRMKRVLGEAAEISGFENFLAPCDPAVLRRPTICIEGVCTGNPSFREVDLSEPGGEQKYRDAMMSSGGP